MDYYSNSSNTKVRDLQDAKQFKFNDEKVQTTTSKEQIKVEATIEQLFDRFEQYAALDLTLPSLNRKNHTQYLEATIKKLSSSFECLDASRPWLAYWILNAASILNIKFSDETYDDVVDFLSRCRCPMGGFGGGPGQLAHLAPTYAAVNALVIVGNEKAYNAIDRNSLRKFFLKVREPNGAYKMHDGGEVDVRGAYCAISVAKLTNISKEDEAILFKDTAKWVADCQTYEGGFGGAPDLEAHGGYSFCAAAALAMLGTPAHVDLNALMRWTVNRQMRYEGGFQGRTNKLVDGCYSFWQGALIPIIQALISREEPELNSFMKRSLFHREALQEYILICCQKPSGGLIDKPGKPADPYHTCYTLSGLSIAQHCDIEHEPIVIGSPLNEVLPTHPVHNVPPKSVLKSYMHFQHVFDELDPLDVVVFENMPTMNGENKTRSSETPSSTGTFERLFKSPSFTEELNSEGKNSESSQKVSTTREGSQDTQISSTLNDEVGSSNRSSREKSIASLHDSERSRSDRESSVRSSSWVDVGVEERENSSQPRSDPSDQSTHDDSVD